MKLQIKSQLKHIEKGLILDDCGPASAAAAASWVHKYEKDFTALDGINAAADAGREDKDGRPDGTNFPLLAKALRRLDCEAGYPMDWNNILLAGKSGKAVIVNVQAPINYPTHAIEANAFAKKLKKSGMSWGHMVCVAYHPEVGWQLADPTMTGKGKEKFGVVISESEFRGIAASKGDAPFKRCLIVRKA